MRRDDVLNILVRHQAELNAFGIHRLALFGSVARNTAGPDSDIDILVEFEGAPTFDRYVELNFHLEALLGRTVDLVTAASLRLAFRTQIEKDVIDVTKLSPLPR